jgi:hypothetical protein
MMQCNTPRRPLNTSHKARSLAAGSILLVLAACGAPVQSPVDPDTGFIRDLPPEVIALADSRQNLQAVRLMEDGCYWYQHSGPVETTMLPLRTPTGSPLCTPRG